MSKRRGIYERLVEQTVRNALFREHAGEKQAGTLKGSSDSERDTTKNTTTTESREGSILQLLTSANNEHTEDPAEDEEDNNAGEARRGSWVADCPNWSIERLRGEKAEIKRYLNAQRLKFADDSQKTPKLLSIHEAYALLKLFLLERDPDYRQCLQQSIGCTTTFLTSLHVLLTLYATYFERAHGRQVLLPCNCIVVSYLHRLKSDMNMYAVDL